jgi:hypothetical protein
LSRFSRLQASPLLRLGQVLEADPRNLGQAQLPRCQQPPVCCQDAGVLIEAHDKMKALTTAAEVLTGVEASAFPRYTGTTFVREMERTEFEAGGVTFTISIGMQVGEIHAFDWIYAASFAANSDSVYLAGYSGRVVLVNENGEGVRVYDIGKRAAQDRGHRDHL